MWMDALFTVLFLINLGVSLRLTRRQGSIGIDLENVHTRKDYHRIRDYYKNGFLAGSTLTKSDFFHRWTLAEAFAKASGVPLLSVLERPLHRQKHSAKYFRDRAFFTLCLSEQLI